MLARGEGQCPGSWQRGIKEERFQSEHSSKSTAQELLQEMAKLKIYLALLSLFGLLGLSLSMSVVGPGGEMDSPHEEVPMDTGEEDVDFFELEDGNLNQLSSEVRALFLMTLLRTSAVTSTTVDCIN